MTIAPQSSQLPRSLSEPYGGARVTRGLRTKLQSEALLHNNRGGYAAFYKLEPGDSRGLQDRLVAAETTPSAVQLRQERQLQKQQYQLQEQHLQQQARLQRLEQQHQQEAPQEPPPPVPASPQGRSSRPRSGAATSLRGTTPARVPTGGSRASASRSGLASSHSQAAAAAAPTSPPSRAERLCTPGQQLPGTWEQLTNAGLSKSGSDGWAFPAPAAFGQLERGPFRPPVVGSLSKSSSAPALVDTKQSITLPPTRNQSYGWYPVVDSLISKVRKHKQCKEVGFSDNMRKSNIPYSGVIRFSTFGGTIPR